MKLSPTIFKAYDVRGIVPDQFDPAMAQAIGRAFARFARSEESASSFLPREKSRNASPSLWMGGCSSPADGALGWFADDNRPTLAVSEPRPNGRAEALTEIRVGVADAYSGVKAGSLSITASFAVNGQAPGNCKFPEGY